VSRIVRRALKLGVVVSIVAGGLALFTNGLASVVLDGWLLGMAAVLLLALYRIARLLAPDAVSPLDQALERMHPRKSAVPELALQRDVSLSRAVEFHFHIRLRPVLREIAAHRLRSRYGVELDREPARARELVPARAWAVVDPDRPPPEDRLAPGPTIQSLSAVVDELERL
jgi:hypothetical protein